MDKKIIRNLHELLQRDQVQGKSMRNPKSKTFHKWWYRNCLLNVPVLEGSPTNFCFFWRISSRNQHVSSCWKAVLCSRFIWEVIISFGESLCNVVDLNRELDEKILNGKKILSALVTEVGSKSTIVSNGVHNSDKSQKHWMATMCYQ